MQVSSLIFKAVLQLVPKAAHHGGWYTGRQPEPACHGVYITHLALQILPPKDSSKTVGLLRQQ